MGILQRYVLGEVLRAFSLALLTVTTVIVLFMVMIEATKMGLAPSEIAHLVPYVVPGSLPYTIPVSLLFAVTIVYGRLASDNEIVAIKTAGLSAWTVLRPAILLGVVLSVGMLYLSHGPIPRANHEAKLVIFKNMEEMFYKFLKRDREFNNPRWPFLIKVRDVRGMTLIEPTFKHRSAGSQNAHSFDQIIQAKTAIIRFDTENSMARVYLDGAETSDQRKDVMLIDEQFRVRRLMAKERKRQSMAASLWIASGRTGRVDWAQVQRSFVDYGTWSMRWNEYETEKQMRIAMACGSLFFVLLGAPVGILFAKRDFLSAFISCFVPIILMYYPLILLGTNMGKDGILNATVALWIGNVVLGVLTGFVLPTIVRH